MFILELLLIYSNKILKQNNHAEHNNMHHKFEIN